MLDDAHTAKKPQPVTVAHSFAGQGRTVNEAGVLGPPRRAREQRRRSFCAFLRARFESASRPGLLRPGFDWTKHLAYITCAGQVGYERTQAYLSLLKLGIILRLYVISYVG